MYYKDFKGEKISALGFGLLRLPTIPDSSDIVDKEKAAEIIDCAIKNGVNYFDTAHNYLGGNSERAAGEILARYPRESYYLATKYSPSYRKPIEEVFETQLKSLQTDHFDFYLLHSIQEENLETYLQLKEKLLGFLMRKKEEGRIKYLGFSSHSAPEVLKKFLDSCGGCFDMALIQLNYVDWFALRAKEQYEILTERGIPVWVMEPLKGGRLSALDEESSGILKTAAPHRSVSSWGMRFLMGLPNVQTVLSGMTELPQVKDNLATFEKYDPLSEAERDALERARRIFVEKLGVPCSACRYCCDPCPAGLDIPLLIRGYNEEKTVGDPWRVEGLSNTKGAEYCLQCGACAKQCPQKIDIPGVMREPQKKK